MTKRQNSARPPVGVATNKPMRLYKAYSAYLKPSCCGFFRRLVGWTSPWISWIMNLDHALNHAEPWFSLNLNDIDRRGEGTRLNHVCSWFTERNGSLAGPCWTAYVGSWFTEPNGSGHHRICFEYFWYIFNIFLRPNCFYWLRTRHHIVYFWVLFYYNSFLYDTIPNLHFHSCHIFSYYANI